MRAPSIVPVTMRFQPRLRFSNRDENLTVKQFIAQLAVETLYKSVLPWAARINEMRSRSFLPKPVLNLGGNKLGAIIATDKIWNAPRKKQRRQSGKNSLACQGDTNRHKQPLAGELVQNVQEAQLAARDQRISLKVVAPHMIWMLGLRRYSQPCLDFALLGPLGHLQAALAPEALPTLVVDGFSFQFKFCIEQSMNTRAAEARVLCFDLFKPRLNLLVAPWLALARMCLVADAGW